MTMKYLRRRSDGTKLNDVSGYELHFTDGSNNLNGKKGKTAVLAMGTPYLTEDFPAIQNYICTFSNATVSEISAARALFGEIPIHGHLPVNIHEGSFASARNERPTQFANMGSPYWYFKATDGLVGATHSP